MYNKKNFLSELINEAIDLEIITEELASNIGLNLAKTLSYIAGIVTESVESRVDEYQKVVMNNHLNVINWYLYTLTPSEAFDKLSNDADSLDKDATKWFGLHVSNLIKRLEDAKELLAEQRADTFMWDSYNHTLKYLNNILKYDVDILVSSEDWLGQYDYLKETCEVIYLP